MSKEQTRKVLEDVTWLYDIQHDFELFNIKVAAGLICPFCQDRNVLEVGCASGEMTEELTKVSRTLTVVEPTMHFSDIVKSKFGVNLKVFSCFLEELDLNLSFEVIVLAGLLHHIERPDLFLMTVKKFLAEDGIVLATVPNMKSLHRRIGVKAGLLKDEYGDTERNIKFHQFGKFDKNSFIKLFEDAGFEVVESYGYMLKPFSSEQMMSLKLDWKVINALFELGKEYEDLASQLFIRSKIK
jgi:2-polyprenyl-3-methyl-5-hydroxy-6-metoxy-1,4-benzoquinol methylase